MNLIGRDWRLAAAALILAFAAGMQLMAQTRLNMTSQTRPYRSGTVLPAVCSAGDMFVKIDAQAGSNLYACTAPNIWTLQGGGSSTGTSLTSILTTRGDWAVSNGSTVVRQPVCSDGQLSIADSTQATGWRCGTITGGTGTPSSGATMAAQLGDL